MFWLNNWMYFTIQDVAFLFLNLAKVDQSFQPSTFHLVSPAQKETSYTEILVAESSESLPEPSLLFRVRPWPWVYSASIPERNGLTISSLATA
jgi:hypothetical protein